MSVPAAATRLGVSPWLVRQLVKSGELPSLRIRRRLLIPTAPLVEWVESHMSETGVAS